MKIVIIYTFLLASGVAIESEPQQPLVDGRAIKTMQVCEEYAAESVRAMRAAIAAADLPLFEDASAECVRVEKGKPLR